MPNPHTFTGDPKVLTNISLTQKIITTFALHKTCNIKYGIAIKHYGTAE